MHRLFRESTKFVNGVHVKDLSYMNRNMKKVHPPSVSPPQRYIRRRVPPPPFPHATPRPLCRWS